MFEIMKDNTKKRQQLILTKSMLASNGPTNTNLVNALRIMSEFICVLQRILRGFTTSPLVF